jgi:hypothetical protein
MTTAMTFEERTYWREMKNALATHNSFRVRQVYYPHNMDTWDKEHREIESFYRTKLNEMLTTRVEAKNVRLAAEALLMLKASTENEIEREATRKRRASDRLAKKQEDALNAANTRRSTRIANKK